MKYIYKNENGPKSANISRIFLFILEGFIIGIGGVLPGVSGGVLCVIFGLYQPVIEVLSNPFTDLKHHWRVIVPVAIGVGLGFIGSAGAVSVFMEKNSQVAVCIFVGLILGMVPELWQDAGKLGRTKGSVPLMVFSFISFTALLVFLKTGTAMNIEPNTFWYGICGVAWGLSIVVPGLSSSSMLIFIGLYQPMLAGMARLDFAVLIPMAIGGCAVVLTLSKLMNCLFERHYSMANHFILGIVLATTLVIVPTDVSGTGQIALCVLCVVAGIVAAIGLNKFCNKLAAQREN